MQRCAASMGAAVANVPICRAPRRQQAATPQAVGALRCPAPGLAQQQWQRQHQHQQRRQLCCNAAQQQEQPEAEAAVVGKPLVGEDAAVFDFSQQSLKSWGLFVALLTGVSALLYPVGGWHCHVRCDQSGWAAAASLPAPLPHTRPPTFRAPSTRVCSCLGGIRQLPIIALRPLLPPCRPALPPSRPARSRPAD